MISNDFTSLHPDPQHEDNPDNDKDPQTPLITQQDDDDDDLFDNIFLQPTKKREESKFSVRALQSQIKNHKAARYLLDFDERAAVEGVTICSVPKDKLEERRRLLAEQQREEWELAEIEHSRYVKALKTAENDSLSRVRLWHQATERYKNHFEHVKKRKHEQYKQSLGDTFHAATKHFRGALRQRKKRMKKTYGELNEFRLKKINRIKHELVWRNVPQKIKLYVKFVRGVKDKLPKGQYILLVTLRDRIGGRIVSIKNRGEKRKKSNQSEYRQGFFQQTMEVNHDGKFSSLELEFEQPLFLVSPSQSQRKPYMVFTFELVQTTGPNAGLCCAWGAFPVEDSSFNVIEGKYKVPLIRGWLTPQIDQYWKFHNQYTKNLERWMGNLYFQVKPLPRERRGRVETQGHVQALKKMSDVVVNDNNIFFSEHSSSDTETEDSEDDLDDPSFDEEDEDMNTDGTDDLLNFSSSDHDSGDDEENEMAIRARKQFEEKMKTLKEDGDEESDSDSDEDNDGLDLDSDSHSSKDSEQDSDEEDRSEESFEGKLDIDSEQAEEGGQEVTIEDTKAAVFRKQRNPAELNKYRYSLPQPTGYKESVLTFRKGKYLTKALLTDMGFSSPTSVFSREFWVSVFLFLLSFFIRQYSHYLGQYLLLLLFDVPSVRYYPNALYVELNYQSLYLSLYQEILIVATGVLTNILFYFLFIMGIYFMQKLRINVPAFASKMCVMFGFATLLDPYLVLLSDLIFQRWNSGDWFKLYIHYESNVSGEGVWGVLITLLLYVYLSLLTGFMIYRFVLRIFMNGQIIDVFRRVHAPENVFFMPLDLEVTREEMEYACSKAKKFRGSGGSIRRLVVMEYALTDPRDPSFFERSIHIIIYSIIPRGKNRYHRKVYRQFLQLENNAIVEIFDDNDAKSLISNQMKNINSSSVVNSAEDNQFQAATEETEDSNSVFDFDDEDELTLTNTEGSEVYEDIQEEDEEKNAREDEPLLSF